MCFMSWYQTCICVTWLQSCIIADCGESEGDSPHPDTDSDSLGDTFPNYPADAGNVNFKDVSPGRHHWYERQ